MQSTPEILQIDDYDGLQARVKSRALLDSDWRQIEAILGSFRLAVNALREKSISVRRLQALLFGPKTEKDPGGIDPPQSKKCGTPAPAADPLGDPPTGVANTPGHEPTGTPISTAGPGSAPIPEPAPKKRRRPGHGRRPHDSWPGATCHLHPHESLKPGDPCPKCGKGKVYPYKIPAVIARVVGRSPLAMEIHKCERLRCSPCGALFTAQAPKDVRDHPSETPEARATAVVMKYQAATPFNRQAAALRSFGADLPRTRLWDMVRACAQVLLPVLDALCEVAARGELVQNDDTRLKVLELMAEHKRAKKEGKKLDRTGMNTTAIVSEAEGRRIYLFFSGRNHAGENLGKLLARRPENLAPPTQVCDGAALNTVAGVRSDKAGCHDHARRKFFEIRQDFPKSCEYALAEWKLIYRADALAKWIGLSPEKRLIFHQRRTGPVLKRMKSWCEAELAEKRAEPNSSLGQAMRYFLKHFPALTLFLRKPGVPLSNAACEQALKTPIAVRKTSYFFKTLPGAAVGDLHFSLIATSLAAKENVYEYYVAAQRHEKDVTDHPELWMPWNFRARLAALQPAVK